MDKQKQIEEEIHKMAQIALGKQVTMECTEFAIEEGFFDNFIALYNAGYRKIDECSVVLTEEEFSEFRQAIINLSQEHTKKCDEMNDKIIKARKQAVKEVMQKIEALYAYLDNEDKIFIGCFREDLDEIAKEFGLDIGE
jgi:uncharacterized HAD superfamily protein